MNKRLSLTDSLLELQIAARNSFPHPNTLSNSYLIVNSHFSLHLSPYYSVHCKPYRNDDPNPIPNLHSNSNIHPNSLTSPNH